RCGRSSGRATTATWSPGRTRPSWRVSSHACWPTTGSTPGPHDRPRTCASTSRGAGPPRTCCPSPERSPDRMAAFDPDVEHNDDRAYLLLRDTAVTMFWRQSVLDETWACLAPAGYAVVSLD